MVLDLIKRYEGFMSKPYLDAVGIPTIGYGFIFRENGQRVKLTDELMTMEEANRLLKIRVDSIITDIKKIVSAYLTENQISCLCSFVYNVGFNNFRKSTLLKKLNNNDFAGAADELLKWNKAGGKEIKGLSNRRKEERELFLKV